MLSDRTTRLALIGALLLVAGCGAATSPSTTSPSATTPGSPPPTATASDGNGVLVPTNLPTDLPTGLPLTGTKPTVGGTGGQPSRVFGADISWPQCPKGMGIPQKRSQGAPMPTDAAEFVIIGLTNGPSFAANPCIADQVGWVASRHLRAAAYAVVSYPDATTLRAYGGKGPFGSDARGRLKNVGYAAALFNLATMKAAGLRSPVVWIDVEPVPDFAWSADTAANAAVVQGAARGYGDAGVSVGYYSTPSLWARVVGYLPTGAPEWRAAGQTSLAEALSRCGPDWSFTGGKAVLGQWVEDGRDRNVTCPGASAHLDRWFHQY